MGDPNIVASAAVTRDESAFEQFVSFTATVTTVGLFTTGIPVCRRIMKAGTTGDITCAPFVMGLTSAILWFGYGFVNGATAIMTTNGFGLVLQSAYTLCFVTYCPARKQVYRYLGGAACLALPPYCYISMVGALHGSDVLGLTAALVTILFCASPLASVGVVLRDKSTESMSFLMSLATFVMAVLWTVYGYLRHDPFVEIPNFVGACLGSLQLCLFFKYPSTKVPIMPK